MQYQTHIFHVLKVSWYILGAPAAHLKHYREHRILHVYNYEMPEAIMNNYKI